MFTSYCPSLVDNAQTNLSVFVGCVHSYQSLIAGLLAILAAYVAARPVWRQLRDIRLQTAITRRETLSLRMHEAIDRFHRADKEMDKPLTTLVHTTWGPAGDPLEIDDNDGHGLYITIAGKLNWYLEDLRETEAHEIEVAKAKLLQAREDLQYTLNEAHWPAAHGQSDETYSLTNEQWQEALEKAKLAKVQAAEKVSAFSAAWHELREAQSLWVKNTRQRIATLDNEISGS